jgi:hypothetical protein
VSSNRFRSGSPFTDIHLPMLANQERAVVWCYDALGNALAVPPERLVYCPSVYGLFLEHGEVWLLHHTATGLFYPPGVILAANHAQPHPRQALLACLRRLTGLTLALGPLLFLEEQYRIDESGQAWHLSAMYYGVVRPSLAVTMPVETDTTVEPAWISLADLTREQMQFGYQAIQAARRVL